MQGQKKTVGLVGFGALGKYLSEAILKSDSLTLAWVWNRSAAKVLEDETVKHLLLEDLSSFSAVDLIVEVAHPDIIRDHAVAFLSKSDFFAGSPTAFADAKVEAAVRAAATQHCCYIPCGALWGADDIAKMADRGTLAFLSVSMAKNPTHLNLNGLLKEKLDEYVASEDTNERVLFEGSVRELCPLAPNNVNTMACAALAGHTVGLDRAQARLIADKKLQAHVVKLTVAGPGAEGDRFEVTSTRVNPAKPGAVTGKATFASFLSSMLVAAKGGNLGGVKIV